MKKIEVIVKPYGLDSVRERLEQFGHLGMTVSEIRNYLDGNDPEPVTVTGSSAEAPVSPPFAARLKVEIVVQNEDVSPVVDIFDNLRGTDFPGRQITVQSLEDVIRIRTSEHGPSAV